MSNTVIEHLKRNRKRYLEITEFSKCPGIYALFFIGKKFPLSEYSPKNDEIIYIGKTESSQDSRDRAQHFSSGKTRSSTLRRSFGSLLRKDLNLVPIPGSPEDIKNKRMSHFSFDEKSEELLTKWMKENLALSFYEFDSSKREIEELETFLIRQLVPVLNLQNNSGNPYLSDIKRLRKESGELAYQNIDMESIKQVRMNSIRRFEAPTLNQNSNKTSSKYATIWESVLSKINSSLEEHNVLEIQMNKLDFDRVGNRKDYSFRLEIVNGKVNNNISGSAVARDLASVLLNSPKFRNLNKGKTSVIRLDKQFILHIN